MHVLWYCRCIHSIRILIIVSWRVYLKEHRLSHSADVNSPHAYFLTGGDIKFGKTYVK